MKENNTHIDEIKSKLDSVEKREQFKSALRGFNISLITGLVANLILSVVILAGATSIEARTVFYFLLISLLGITIVYFVVIPLFKTNIFFKPDYSSIAERVGNYFPEIKDQLKNVLQLITSKDKYPRSEKLVEAAFENIYAKTSGIKFIRVVNFNSVKKYFITSSSAIVVSAMLFALQPALRNASFLLLNYSTVYTAPQKFNLLVEPGNAEVTKGTNVWIKISATGDTPGEITLAVKSKAQTDFTEKQIIADSLGNFKVLINNVAESFKYYAYSGSISSDIFNLEVIDPPIVNSFDVTVTPPRYSKIAAVKQKDNGNITALPGSRMQIELYSSKEMKEAKLVFSDSTKSDFDIDGNKADVQKTILKEANYFFSLIDTQGNENVNPITYSIKLMNDLPPAIEMISPNSDVKITEGNILQLQTRISDDYGFSKLTLNYRLSASQFETPWADYKTVSITIRKDSKEQDVFYSWDLEPLFLAVNDVVSYYLEIFDNDDVNGPKSSKTHLFSIRVPSVDELFAEAETTQESAEQDLVETLKEVEEFNKELQRISDELKQDNREISWEEKEKIENATKKFQEFEQKVEDIQNKLNDMQKKLQENNLLSEETMQKYMELQELMDELSSDELSEAFKKMQEMLESLSRDKTQQAFENMQFNEEMFQKSLERTLNLLKRIQVEQKVDEIVKRIEDLEKKLEDVQKDLSENSANNEQKKNELMQKQNDISKNMQRLEEEMSKLQDKMSKMSDMPLDEMKKISEQMKEQANSELSEQTEQKIQENQKAEAIENMQMLSQNMQSMKEQMQQMQSNMQMQNQMQTAFDIMKSLNDLVALSKDEESLKAEILQNSLQGERQTENMKTQSEIQHNLDKVVKQLVDLSQKTFAITPEMGKALGQARNEMSESLSSMQNRNSTRAAQSQSDAMKALNEAATLLKGGLDQMMNGGQGGGMMSLMQQLQQMSQQQMNLNQLTQQMNQGQLSQQQRAQIQRLAQEQDLIRKSLEQLNNEAKESGQSKKLSANLEKVLEEMKEIVSNMQTEKINDDLIQAQERILSKLLDAQRSINERDFEKERESTAGRIFNRESPPELIFSTEEGKDKLRDELLKAIREGYSKDYEELIRKYYEQLSSQKNGEK